jgi:hypothetical protein
MKRILKTVVLIFLVHICLNVSAYTDDSNLRKFNKSSDSKIRKITESGDNKAPKRGKPIRGHGN